ncbi:putative UvrABC system protein C [Caldisericum exile AZM16c01]|uniref:UvrABC system protein C n=1 Tax=Caldisericum exile (strain DSM 21853 / NBRC 104410 / AZM16c01) TaxID=511051 RepID=A0A7U6GED2_CALEA|nr:putative UvrABC system protein C [Caldisericum exile AZM16c01]
MEFLPDSSGVYILKDKENKVIYVGKAKSLKKRVSSYKNPKDTKGKALFSRIRTIEFIITENPDEALLLENNLIKKFKPPFNVRLVDDENYPYIKITDEEYPKIQKVYRIRGEKGNYFGPFPHGKAVDTTIKTLRKIFPIRSCNLKISEEKKYQPCMLYQIGLCSAPCAHLISKVDYIKTVENLKTFLRSEDKSIINTLANEMEKAKRELQFERAIIYRDAINGLNAIFSSQRVITEENVNFDLITGEIKGDKSCVVKVTIRNGRVVSLYPFILESLEDKPTLIEQFLISYSQHATSEKIYVDCSLENKEALEKFLKEKTGHKVQIVKAKGKASKKVLEFAKENAKLHLENYLKRKENETPKVLVQMKEILSLKHIPIRIEGYDISNIQGKFAVGSMVVFTRGKKDKDEYRRFRIKFVEGPNDYAMLYEVLLRRFMHNEEGFSKELPNLVLIDGGLGQLEVGKKVKEILNLDVDFISLAKKEELVFTEKSNEPIRLERDSPVLKLLQQVRDESHRFAKAYFKELHSKIITEDGNEE